jgi:hypothetical protein
VGDEVLDDLPLVDELFFCSMDALPSWGAVVVLECFVIIRFKEIAEFA